MAAVVVISLMALSGLLGYLVGRRATRRAPTWQQRIQRPALARQAVTLMALVAASQLHRSAHRRVGARRRGYR
ncbi:hypothetical protein EV589_1737 [Mycobacterium sp. BK558]|nr:hypothetical protein EV589_1737 [Mycobacterium sp. BK558]